MAIPSRRAPRHHRALMRATIRRRLARTSRFSTLTPVHRDFLAIPDFSRDELEALLRLAERMRRGEYGAQPLAGKTLGMLFLKSSTRTRVSFEVGTRQLGGHALFLSSRDVQIGRGE